MQSEFKNSHEFEVIIKQSNFCPHSIISFTKKPIVLDLSNGSEGWDGDRPLFTIGKYNEKRLGLYKGEQFKGVRNIHVGIDIGAPVGTKVLAPLAGMIFCVHNNDKPYDYGPTLITEHYIESKHFWILWGHLSWESVENLQQGQTFEAGECLCKIGNEDENGGWPSHLHFQISLRKPVKCDLPGAVSDEDLEEALAIYPDPRFLLGELY